MDEAFVLISTRSSCLSLVVRVQISASDRVDVICWAVNGINNTVIQGVWQPWKHWKSLEFWCSLVSLKKTWRPWKKTWILKQSWKPWISLEFWSSLEHLKKPWILEQPWKPWISLEFFSGLENLEKALYVVNMLKTAFNFVCFAFSFAPY